MAGHLVCCNGRVGLAVGVAMYMLGTCSLYLKVFLCFGESDDFMLIY